MQFIKGTMRYTIQYHTTELRQCYRNMFTTVQIFSILLGLSFRLLQEKTYSKHKNSLNLYQNKGRFQISKSLANKPNLDKHTVVFNVEGALLKSPSLFPYFMLVAFEGGSIFRAFFLLILYPFISLVNEKGGLKIMVFVSFFGIKKEGFNVGRAVLPKFFLEDVGLEGFEMVMRGKKAVGVSDMPSVMVESFLKDYLNVDNVFGREIKVFHGYFLGLMVENKHYRLKDFENMIGVNEMGICDEDVIGLTSLNKCSDFDQIFSHCKEIYFTSETEKMEWKELKRNNYPKPLIFHDGRLAIKPTLSVALAIFMWIPVGFILAIIRILLAISLPYNVSGPILAFSGLQLRVSNPETILKNNTLYVCNHRTLVDPLYLCFMMKKNLTAVTYSLSRMAEILAPIKTVRLTRDRDQDAKMMGKLLSQGSLVVCPEGTTCREPYLLRFSPLFAELSDQIVPVAINTQANMFYGTTASGLKFLDPIFFSMNPFPNYTINILDKVTGSAMCRDNGESRIQVSNHVQNEIGKALGFECTKLTRKDKYLILAGNEGVVNTNTKPRTGPRVITR